MQKTKPGPQYKGVLRRPMVQHRAATSFAEVVAINGTGGVAVLTHDIAVARNAEQVDERTVALYAHYGISSTDPHRSDLLVVALATDHVPGFRWGVWAVKGGGRPPKWHGDKSIELYADVTGLMRGGKDASSACRVLAGKQFADRYPNESCDNLLRRFYEAPTAAGPISLGDDRPPVRVDELSADAPFLQRARHPKIKCR